MNEVDIESWLVGNDCQLCRVELHHELKTLEGNTGVIDVPGLECSVIDVVNHVELAIEEECEEWCG